MNRTHSHKRGTREVNMTVKTHRSAAAHQFAHIPPRPIRHGTRRQRLRLSARLDAAQRAPECDWAFIRTGQYGESTCGRGVVTGMQVRNSRRPFRRRLVVAAGLLGAGYAGMAVSAPHLRAAQLHRRPAPAGWSGMYLLAAVVALIGLAVLLNIGWRAWRDRRRAHGHLTGRERGAREQQLLAAQSATDGWIAAQHHGQNLLAGGNVAPMTVWGVVLQPGEVLQFDLVMDYARFYGMDASYSHVNGLFFGSVPFMVAGTVLTAVGNRGRRRRAQAASLASWREQSRARILVTDQRLMCHVSGQWLSFWYSGVHGFYPEPENWSVVLDSSGAAPLRLSGTAAPLLAVHLTAAMHGTDALLQHPALAQLRGSGFASPGLELRV